MMALYGYCCPACGWTNEVFRDSAERDTAPPRCDFCHGLNYYMPMRREIVSVAIRGETVSKP